VTRVKAAVSYFGLVFTAGFVLGIVRVLWVIPAFGARTAELLEMPLMIGVMIIAARWTVRRFELPGGFKSRLGVGLAALGLMLLAEIGVVIAGSEASISEYIARKDPVSGTAYLLALGLFSILPSLLPQTRP
jgi:hypothetical protein